MNKKIKNILYISIYSLLFITITVILLFGISGYFILVSEKTQYIFSIIIIWILTLDIMYYKDKVDNTNNTLNSQISLINDHISELLFEQKISESDKIKELRKILNEYRTTYSTAVYKHRELLKLIEKFNNDNQNKIEIPKHLLPESEYRYQQFWEKIQNKFK